MTNSIRFGGVHIKAENRTCYKGSYYKLDVYSSSPSIEVGNIRDLMVFKLVCSCYLGKYIGTIRKKIRILIICVDCVPQIILAK